MDKGNFSVVGAIALNSALGDNPKFSHQLIDRFGSMEELFSFGRSGKQDLFGPYSRFSSAFLEQSLEEAENNTGNSPEKGFSLSAFSTDNIRACSKSALMHRCYCT